MIATLPIHFSAIEQMAFSQGTTTRLLMACAMGGMIGVEREWRHKASGLRTNMLMCMGAALFTVLSGGVAGEQYGQRAGGVEHRAGDRVSGRGADSAYAQPGAGAHQRGDGVGGGAIGMACGAGLYMGAAIATAIVFVALRFIGLMGGRSGWKRYPMLYEVRGSDENTMFGVLAVLDREHLRLNILERDKLGELERVTFTIAASSARHKQLLAELVASDAADTVVAFPDEEED